MNEQDNLLTMINEMKSGMMDDIDDNDDIQDIMNMIDEYECPSNIEDKTTDGIIQEIFQVLTDHHIPNIDIVSSKLIGYMYIDEICDIRKGRHVRWVRITPGSKLTLTNGGVIMDTKFTNNGTQILCKNRVNKFMQYKFDECISFQRMSKHEQLIAMANSSIESFSA
jgi:hypothetical protein